jgi:LuxR family maltose regulon positive regulatory protein
MPLARALASASRFSSVQPIATFGIAVLPLLQESDWNEGPKFLARTIAFVRQQATFYPTYTQPPVKLERPLTWSEEKALRLIPQTSRMPLSARS